MTGTHDGWFWGYHLSIGEKLLGKGTSLYFGFVDTKNIRSYKQRLLGSLRMQQQTGWTANVWRPTQQSGLSTMGSYAKGVRSDEFPVVYPRPALVPPADSERWEQKKYFSNGLKPPTRIDVVNMWRFNDVNAVLAIPGVSTCCQLLASSCVQATFDSKKMDVDKASISPKHTQQTKKKTCAQKI